MSFFDPRHMAMVPDARFRLRIREEKLRRGRDVLVISLHGLTKAEKKELRKKYLEEFSKYLSFPLKEGTAHLWIRFRDRVEDFTRVHFNWLYLFRSRAYFLPRTRSRTMEIMLKLEPEEEANLRTYIRNVRWRRRRTIGKFEMRGTQFSEGRLDNNLPRQGFHNCTSWITTAPIGPGGEALLEILGGDRSLEIGTNPGWWNNWLAVTVPTERLPHLLLWTPEPLAEALSRIETGKNLEWNFNRH